MKTYWSEVEYRYAQSESGNRKLRGGFVYAFVAAFDARDALTKIEAAMSAEDLEPEKVVYISPYGETSWEKEEDQRKFSQLVRQAEMTGRVIFDEFYAFENDK